MTEKAFNQNYLQFGGKNQSYNNEKTFSQVYQQILDRYPAKNE